MLAGAFFILAISAWLALEFWLIPRVLKRVEESLANDGIYLSYRDLDVALPKGTLDVTDITLHRTARKQAPIFFLNKFRIKVNPWDLLWAGEPAGTSTIRNGTIRFLGRARQTEFENLNAELEFDQSHLRIRQFRGECNFGYRVSLTGMVRWAASAANAEPEGDTVGPEQSDTAASTSPEESSPPESQLDFSWMESLAEALYCEPTGTALPSVELDVTWDETRAPKNYPLYQLTAKGKLSGQDTVFRDLPIRTFNSEFRIENSAVSIPTFELEGLRGALSASGTYRLESDQLTIRKLESTIDPIEVTKYLNAEQAEMLSGVEYDVPPTITGENLLINIRDFSASEIKMAIDAQNGIRYRDGRGKDDVIKLQNLQATVDFGQSSEWRVHDLEAGIHGLDLRGNVTLRNHSNGGGAAATTTLPQLSKRKSPPQNDPETLQLTREPSFVRRLNHLLQIESKPDQRPLLDLEVVLDNSPSQGENFPLKLAATYSGSSFSWQGRAVDSANASVRFEDGLLEFDRVRITTELGSFQTAGSYDFTEKSLRIPDLSSTIDLDLLRTRLEIELPSPVDEVAFPAPPQVTIKNLELQFGESLAGKGSVELVAEKGCSVSDGKETLTASRLELAMAWKEPQVLTIERALGRIGDLEFKVAGQLPWNPAEFNSPSRSTPTSPPLKVQNSGPAVGKLGNKDASRSIVATLKEYLAVDAEREPVQLICAFDWTDSPDAKQASEPKWASCLRLKSTISGNNFDWHGFSVKQATSTIEIQNGVVQFSPLLFKTTDGIVESDAAYSIASKRLRMTDLQLTIDPVVLFKHLGIAGGFPENLEILAPPTLAGKDIFLDFENMKASSGTLQKTNSSGIALKIADQRQIPFLNAKGQLSFSNGAFEINKFTADVFGGDARSNFRSTTGIGMPAYDFDITTRKMSLNMIETWLNPSDEPTQAGTVDLNFSGNGSDTLESLTGRGQVTATSNEPVAQTFSMVNSLVGVLEGVFPALAEDRGWDLDLIFTVKEGRIQTEKAILTNHRSKVEVSGYVDVIKDQVDLVARINVRGLIGVATALTKPLRSDFMELRGTGTLKNIKWKRQQPRGLLPKLQ